MANPEELCRAAACKAGRQPGRSLLVLTNVFVILHAPILAWGWHSSLARQVSLEKVLGNMKWETEIQPLFGIWVMLKDMTLQGYRCHRTRRQLGLPGGPRSIKLEIVTDAN